MENKKFTIINEIIAFLDSLTHLDFLFDETNVDSVDIVFDFDKIGFDLYTQSNKCLFKLISLFSYGDDITIIRIRKLMHDKLNSLENVNFGILLNFENSSINTRINQDDINRILNLRKKNLRELIENFDLTTRNDFKIIPESESSITILPLKVKNQTFIPKSYFSPNLSPLIVINEIFSKLDNLLFFENNISFENYLFDKYGKTLFKNNIDFRYDNRFFIFDEERKLVFSSITDVDCEFDILIEYFEFNQLKSMLIDGKVESLNHMLSAFKKNQINMLFLKDHFEPIYGTASAVKLHEFILPILSIKLFAINLIIDTINDLLCDYIPANQINSDLRGDSLKSTLITENENNLSFETIFTDKQQLYILELLEYLSITKDGKYCLTSRKKSAVRGVVEALLEMNIIPEKGLQNLCRVIAIKIRLDLPSNLDCSDTSEKYLALAKKHIKNNPLH